MMHPKKQDIDAKEQKQSDNSDASAEKEWYDAGSGDNSADSGSFDSSADACKRGTNKKICKSTARGKHQGSKNIILRAYEPSIAMPANDFLNPQMASARQL